MVTRPGNNLPRRSRGGIAARGTIDVRKLAAILMPAGDAGFPFRGGCAINCAPRTGG